MRAYLEEHPVTLVDQGRNGVAEPHWSADVAAPVLGIPFRQGDLPGGDRGMQWPLW